MGRVIAAGSRKAIGPFRAVVRGIVAIPMAPVVVLAALASRLAAALAAAARDARGWCGDQCRSSRSNSGQPRCGRGATRAAVRARPLRDQRAVGLRPLLRRIPAARTRFDPLRAYMVFLWVLAGADMYLCFFDGGFLRERHCGGWSCRCCGSPASASSSRPTGGTSPCRDTSGWPRNGCLGGLSEDRARVGGSAGGSGQFAHWASLVVRNYQYGYLPRWDVLWPTQIAIDAQLWSPAGEPGEGDGRDGEVVVVHAPNHRQSRARTGSSRPSRSSAPRVWR